jgi:hypothetical protein
MQQLSRKEIAHCKRSLRQSYQTIEELREFFSARGDTAMAKRLVEALEAILEAINYLPSPEPKL